MLLHVLSDSGSESNGASDDPLTRALALFRVWKTLCALRRGGWQAPPGSAVIPNVTFGERSQVEDPMGKRCHGARENSITALPQYMKGRHLYN